MQVNKDIEKKFAVSVATPWIKGKMDVDSHNVMIDIPNTVLFGLIPAGRRKHTTPLGNVSNVYTSSSYKLVRMIFGLLICLLSFGLFGTSFIRAFVLLALGALIIASGIITVFRYENNGHSVSVPLPFFEAHHAQAFADKVIAQINQYNDHRNGYMNAQMINNQQAQSTEQIINAMKK
ncbi:Uncharacterised protein [Staphylococcus microti]|uniref:Uncharacterized protein n=1 Tax=Staphylococcus microti TaxID=569857 RepID=A0A380GQ02_9STAP|nr:hypothetical protein [Staphylococcus microti]PNZ84023.1 hypothetical protein CD132_01245 [Staphylococcus microti]SUM56506.1 Uncharacterised protein [Staphylococcus microti]